MLINFSDIKQKKHENQQKKPTVDIHIGGKYMYEAADGQQNPVMIVDTDTHIAVIDFIYGSPVKTIQCLNQDKTDCLQKLIESLSGRFIGEIKLQAIQKTVFKKN